MEKTQLLTAIKEARNSAKRKFSQSFDLVVNLRGINAKKDDEKISTFIELPHTRGRKINVTALVGKELSAKAKEACNNVLLLDSFKTLEKKQIKKIARETDYFIAQANIMPQVAAAFGKTLGPRGLMPNPKAGCILQPTDEVKPAVERLQKLVKLETKNEPTIKTSIGNESMKDDDIADNALTIYNSLLTLLPQEKVNIKSILVKLTMGKPAAAFSTQKAVKKEQEPERAKQKVKSKS